MAAVESASSEQGQEQGSGTSEEASPSGNPSETGSADQEAAAESGDASMEGGEPGDTAGEAASAGNTSGEDSSGNQRSGEDASAAGTSDGSKEFVEAEQVEVFGELENLYMERAEKMKGEVTIETRPGRAVSRSAVQSAFYQPCRHGERHQSRRSPGRIPNLHQELLRDTAREHGIDGCYRIDNAIRHRAD